MPVSKEEDPSTSSEALRATSVGYPEVTELNLYWALFSPLKYWLSRIVEDKFSKRHHQCKQGLQGTALLQGGQQSLLGKIHARVMTEFVFGIGRSNKMEGNSRGNRLRNLTPAHPSS